MCHIHRVQLETLGHILWQCTHTKAQTTHHHNEIKDLVVEKITDRDKKAVVTREPTIRVPSWDNLKPDLMVKYQEGVFMVNITVRHKDGDYLERGCLNKMEKYTPLLRELKQCFRAASADIIPVVVCTRRAMPKETTEALRKLKITKRKTLLTISLTALKKSIEMCCNFKDYNARSGDEDCVRASRLYVIFWVHNSLA
jgi:hypothetical protein